jgi:glyoxylase-like metal-dependent hydrolase (beta-lactamase superfamily II)
MDATPEPVPLAAPLPGGHDGATVRVHPLLAGEMLSPACFVARRPGPLGALRDVAEALTSRRSWSWVPIPVFLVEHPSAGLVLIDTGFHPSVAQSERPNMGPLARPFYRVRIAPEQLLPTQLAARGFALGDVRTVVMTHLHVDHASGVSELPQATFVVDQAEWTAAHARGGTLAGYVRRQFDHPFDWRAIDYADPRVAPHSTFARSVDLFGDGSVRLCSTPGHTLGHQSLLLRLRERTLLLVGDAAFTRETLAGETTTLLTADAGSYRRSLDELRRFLAQEPETIAIPGHDPAAWAELAPRYD